ncbi:Sensor histidine kinase RegB [Rhodobacteraceae bacterium THAF1]|uniref:sensor histidine kinase RegB n=1 Tax=Palleronia sp. THAF1 TaxID=2587842 RepID=UPI000F3F29FB|nr:ActS/PrrB/RegB family redox-sensitive histidine kinase [Palleronia sp. THAF1]QFU10133.1 Sensor histidine kinase RegB [Palleronia sp. THAF1]VDC16962.1 Sensor histidine kinase RegB [Rhodobacteraceae bacterium THAF1]
MTQAVPDPLDPRLAFSRRADWVRVRTLVLLRWIAIAGQIIAVVVAMQLFGFSVQIGLVTVVIGAAAITNLMATLVFPENRRLSERELVGLLVFDMIQLALLLTLTGGLNNPFALLVLAQVAIAATALPYRATILVCVVGILATTSVGFFHAPLLLVTGEVLELPPLFQGGFWVAIVIGITFQAGYAHRVASEVTAMGDALTATQMALSREQKLTDLGGVVAATAHELGTPLATIAVVSAELVQELDDDDQRADAQLIRDQAERCRVILREMGRAGKQDTHIRIAPMESVVQEAAEPHLDRGIDVRIEARAEPGHDPSHPSVHRLPEIIHGLRNLVQNAVDFATTTVWVDLRWSESTITIRIADDGPGYPPDMLPRLGDPFQRQRQHSREESGNRRSYDGMGLGLFIAKTLLERSGAETTFANGVDSRRKGAVVSVVWQRDAIAIAHDRPALSENMPTA